MYDYYIDTAMARSSVGRKNRIISGSQTKTYNNTNLKLSLKNKIIFSEHALSI